MFFKKKKEEAETEQPQDDAPEGVSDTSPLGLPPMKGGETSEEDSEPEKTEKPEQQQPGQHQDASTAGHRR